MASLLLIPLDDTVVFPTMDVTLPVDTGDEAQVLLVPRHEGEYAKVGTIARVAERVRLPGGARGAHLQGEARGVAGAASTGTSSAARASSSASTARRSKRSSSCAATTAASRPGSARSPSRVRWPTPQASPRT